MITFRHEWQNSDKDPDIKQYMPPQTVVPVVAARAGKWTLDTNWTVDGDGYIDAAVAAAATAAERWVPGVLEGHKHQIVITIASIDDPIDISMGGVTLVTGLAAPGTYTYWFVPVDGSPLKFNYPSGTGLTASITSVVVTAHDPINLDLIPPVQVFSA